MFRVGAKVTRRVADESGTRTRQGTTSADRTRVFLDRL